MNKNNVWDVAIYGSYARGEESARDIDIAIILKEQISANRKLLLAQELRHKLNLRNLDVKAIDLNDLLNPAFLARESILAEGKSVIKGDFIAERFGFDAVVLVEYSLKKLNLSQQKMLYYALQGRKNGEGILSKLKGRIVAKGVLEVPTRNYEEIKNLLNENNVLFKSTFILKYGGV